MKVQISKVQNFRNSSLKDTVMAFTDVLRPDKPVVPNPILEIGKNKSFINSKN